MPTSRHAARRNWFPVLVVVLVLVAVAVTSFYVWQQTHGAKAAATRPASYPSVTTQDPSSTGTPPAVAAGSSVPSVTQTTKPTPAATTPTHPAPAVMPITPQYIKMPELVSSNQPADLKRALKDGVKVVAKPSSWQCDGHLTGPAMTGSQRCSIDGQPGWTAPMYGVPDDLISATWWSADQNGVPAPKPGGPPGNLHIAEFFVHTGIDGAQGVGNNFGQLHNGDQFTLYGQNASGQTVEMTLVVVRVKPQLSKSDPNALNDSIAQAPASTRVSFFTCSGSVNESISSSNFNTEIDTTIRSAKVVGK